MLFQLRLVRQNTVETAVQAAVVDLAFFDLQQIIQCRRWIPALLDRQLAAGCAEPVDGQHRGHARPWHLRRIVVHRLLEEAIVASTTPSLENRRQTVGFSPGGLDSLRLALPADHRPAPRYAKEIVAVAELRPAR